MRRGQGLRDPPQEINNVIYTRLQIFQFRLFMAVPAVMNFTLEAYMRVTPMLVHVTLHIYLT
jgi:hypothetical protein